MASIRDMHARIQTVESIGQLTRALQAISASQVKTVKMLAEDSLPYIQYAGQIITDMMKEVEFQHQYRAFNKPELDKDALIVFISADRGLAGSYIGNIFRELTRLERKINTPVQYLTVGKKGREMLLRRKRQIVADFSELSTATNFHQLKALSNIVIEDYHAKKYGQVHIVYTEYLNMARQVPISRRLLPIDKEFQASIPNIIHEKLAGHCIFEGDPYVIMNSLLSRFIRMTLFHAVTSSKASEHTARMMAMNTATENTENIIGQLQLEYNKVRQQSITSGILDIIGGTVGLTDPSPTREQSISRTE